MFDDGTRSVKASHHWLICFVCNIEYILYARFSLMLLMCQCSFCCYTSTCIITSMCTLKAAFKGNYDSQVYDVQQWCKMCLLRLHTILLPVDIFTALYIAWGYREAATLSKVSQLQPSKGALHQECHNLFTVWGDQGSSEAADKCHWTRYVTDTRVPSEAVLHSLTAREGMNILWSVKL